MAVACCPTHLCCRTLLPLRATRCLYMPPRLPYCQQTGRYALPAGAALPAPHRAAHLCAADLPLPAARTVTAGYCSLPLPLCRYTARTFTTCGGLPHTRAAPAALQLQFPVCRHTCTATHRTYTPHTPLPFTCLPSRTTYRLRTGGSLLGSRAPDRHYAGLLLPASPPLPTHHLPQTYARHLLPRLPSATANADRACACRLPPCCCAENIHTLAQRQTSAC